MNVGIIKQQQQQIDSNMQGLPPTDAQLKNQQFRKQIRRRMIDNYMKSVRSKFLKLNQEQQQQNNQVTDVQQLKSVLTRAPTSSNLSLINSTIIKQDIKQTQTMIGDLISYVNINFLNKDMRKIGQKPQINHLIALLANLFALKTLKQALVSQFDVREVMQKMLFLIDKVPQKSATLLVWVLFQITIISPQNTLQRIADVQNDLRLKLGISDVHLSYLFLNLMQNNNLLQSYIVEQYTQVSLKDDEVNHEYCQNIIYIFHRYLKQNGSNHITQSILGWTSDQLGNPKFPSLLKTDLLYLMYNCIQNNLDILTLSGLNCQTTLINQLIYRSLYDDNLQNKTTCLMCLNSLIKKSPKMQLQQLIFNNPTILEVLISSFYLENLQLRVGGLASLAKIIVTWPSNRQIHSILIQNGFKSQLDILSDSKNYQISELARALIEEYLTY